MRVLNISLMTSRATNLFSGFYSCASSWGGPVSQIVSLKPLIEIRNTLNSIFVGREIEIMALLTALVSGEPLILVGDPGTAKTAMIEALSKLINAKYFYYLLTRFTEPDELLGPVDIQALREGKYARITKNRLPDAEIVFLDEIFKASSAVRNILLDIILNKRILNGTEYIKLPMLTLYTASNEISTDAEDKAFYDRLTIRVFVKYVEDSLWEELITKGVVLPQAMSQLKPVADANYIRTLQSATIQRAISIANNPEYRGKFIEALSLLKQKGVEISDRRKIKILYVASAISIVLGEDTPSLDSLADALRFVAVHTEDDVSKIEEVVLQARLSVASEQVKKLMTLIAELENAINNVKQLGDKATMSDIRSLKTIAKRAIDELKVTPRTPRLVRYTSKLQSLVNEAINLIKQVEIS
jgi:MoxR-like ATPase